jgi:RNA recognition motif-containing protein
MTEKRQSLMTDEKLSMSLDDLISSSKQPKQDRPRRSTEDKLAMSLEDLITEKRPPTTNYRQRSPRRTDSRRRVTVTNVPYDLTSKDLREAFESVGDVERCHVDRGKAWVTFRTAREAQQAVRTYDRGEINGRTIRAVIE